jgi:glycosyltransferase involved in cell wall biosynthesis
MSNNKISAIILTKNRQSSIAKCIESVLWCNEIVIIDDFSTDNTLKIAKQFNTNIYQRKLSNNFASQRNFGASKAKNDWVLFIDSDETVPKILVKEIKTNFKNKLRSSVFQMRRNDFFLGKKLKYGLVAKSHHSRLYNKKKASWSGLIRESLIYKEETIKLINKITHIRQENFSQMIDKTVDYAKMSAEEMTRKKYNPKFYKLFTTPAKAFCLRYFYYLAFLDGIRGFLLSSLVAIANFISLSIVIGNNLNKRSKKI